MTIAYTDCQYQEIQCLLYVAFWFRYEETKMVFCYIFLFYTIYKMYVNVSMLATENAITYRQLVTAFAYVHIGSGKWKSLFGATFFDYYFLQNNWFLLITMICYYFEYTTGYYKRLQPTILTGFNWLLRYDMHIWRVSPRAGIDCY